MMNDSVEKVCAEFCAYCRHQMPIRQSGGRTGGPSSTPCDYARVVTLFGTNLLFSVDSVICTSYYVFGTTMTRLKLTYFDFHGGRGETARLALAIAGIPFEDERIAFADWSRLKAEMPFGALPVLEVDGRVVSQSNGINRYIGKLSGLYPTDPWQAVLCDEVMDAVEDIGTKVVSTFDLPDAEKKSQREALAAGPLASYLKGLARRLDSAGGAYFADNRLTVADLRVFVWIRHLKSGALDHIPVDLPERVAPAVDAHYQRIKNEEGVNNYCRARRIPCP